MFSIYLWLNTSHPLMQSAKLILDSTHLQCAVVMVAAGRRCDWLRWHEYLTWTMGDCRESIQPLCFGEKATNFFQKYGNKMWIVYLGSFNHKHRRWCHDCPLTPGLMDMANEFCEEQLKKLCGNSLVRTICLDNVSALYSVGHKLDCQVCHQREQIVLLVEWSCSRNYTYCCF